MLLPFLLLASIASAQVSLDATAATLHPTTSLSISAAVLPGTPVDPFFTDLPTGILPPTADLTFQPAPTAVATAQSTRSYGAAEVAAIVFGVICAIQAIVIVGSPRILGWAG